MVFDQQPEYKGGEGDEEGTQKAIRAEGKARTGSLLGTASDHTNIISPPSLKSSPLRHSGDFICCKQPARVMAHEWTRVSRRWMKGRARSWEGHEKVSVKGFGLYSQGGGEPLELLTRGSNVF